MKNWDLSYECLTSEIAKCTLQETLDEDPQFGLSISQPHVDGHDTDEDEFVDGQIFEDDLAIPADTLVNSLKPDNDRDMDIPPDISLNEDGDLVIHSRLDDELTDADADGETDPKLDQDSDVEMEIHNDTITDKPNDGELVNCDIKSADSDEDEDFEDPFIVPVASIVVPLMTEEHFVDELEGR
jgi:hypothetical protein